MPPVEPNTGLEFPEKVSGFFAWGASDPEAGETAGRTGQTRCRWNLVLRIPSLLRFKEAAAHEIEIAGGDVSFDGCGPLTIVPGGKVVLFRPDATKRSVKYVDFAFPVVNDNGEGWDCTGWKVLRDDSGFDSPADLSTVFCRLTKASATVAAGVLRVHPDEFLDQLSNLRVIGARDRRRAEEARKDFLEFMNSEISLVYPEAPLVFRNEQRLTPGEWRVLSLIARALRPANAPDSGPTVEDVVEQLQKYVRHADSRQLTTIRFQLNAISLLDVFITGEVPKLRTLAEAILLRGEHPELRDTFETLHLLVAFPYYSHPKADSIVRYSRPTVEPRRRPPLDVVHPDEVESVVSRSWDVVIVGSGPAGSLLADRLSEGGRSVLLLESGPYVPEDAIDSDEVRWTAGLYKSGALQRANDSESARRHNPSFLVIQAQCVGGGGVVNNAVCFRMMPKRLEHWHSLGFPVSAADLNTAYDRVGEDLDICRLSESSLRVNPAGDYLSAFGPVRPPDTGEPQRPGFFECAVNLERKTGDGDETGCLGYGLCNVGCGASRKNNALKVYLPNALRRDCELVAGAEVREVFLTMPRHTSQKVTGLLVRVNGKEFTVRGKEYILSAGAVGSSAILLRSWNLRDRLKKKIGGRFSANIGSPIHAFYSHVIHERPGTQIAHYVIPENPDAGFILETWYNPPGAQALAMPGYLEEHFDRMRRYASTIAAAPLIGTQPSGRVSIVDGRVQIDFTLGSVELNRLKDALSFLARGMLQGGNGKTPDFLLAAVGRGRVLRSPADVDLLMNDLTRIDQLKVGTGHPQGGSAMTTDAEFGVVDPSYRVEGIDNLRVCDGSIFPDSSQVNPQWTIMALAHDCASVMLQGG